MRLLGSSSPPCKTCSEMQGTVPGVLLQNLSPNPQSHRENPKGQALGIQGWCGTRGDPKGQAGRVPKVPPQPLGCWGCAEEPARAGMVCGGSGRGPMSRGRCIPASPAPAAAQCSSCWKGRGELTAMVSLHCSTKALPGFGFPLPFEVKNELFCPLCKRENPSGAALELWFNCSAPDMLPLLLPAIILWLEGFRMGEATL